jgi:hypothetical protein
MLKGYTCGIQLLDNNPSQVISCDCFVNVRVLTCLIMVQKQLQFAVRGIEDGSWKSISYVTTTKKDFDDGMPQDLNELDSGA